MITSTGIKIVKVRVGISRDGATPIAQAQREFVESDPRRSSLVRLDVSAPYHMTLDEARDFATGLLAVVNSVAGEL